MKLSIIVPVYDVEPYLHECIDSILKQSFRDFELILVNDCSPDRCGEICDIYAKEDKRIHIIHHTENGGLSAARNTGIEAATGEYLAFIDSDDFIGKEYFARAIQILNNQQKEPDIVELPIEVQFNSQSHYCYGEQTRKDLATTFPQSWTTWIEREGATHTYAVNKIYHRKLFKRQRFPIGKAFEDLCTIPRIMKKAKSIVYCGATTPDERYYYRLRNNSITTTASCQALCDAMRHHLPIITELTYTTYPISRRSIATYFLQVTNFYIEMLRNKEKDEEKPPLEQRTYKVLKRLTPGRWMILSASKGVRSKIKNLPLALFGLRIHCFLYSGKWVKIQRSTRK